MAHRIFSILEILRLIFSHLERRDLGKIVSVSRRFFASSIPFAWEEVSGSERLRRLIFPHVQIAGVNQDWIESIEPLDQLGLTRFNLYAPHIKYLSDYVNKWNEGQRSMTSWMMILKAVPTRPLLPNLRSCLIPDEYQMLGTSRVVCSFLCPTLVELRTSGRQEGNTHPVLSPQLMAKIAESAPKLQTLELYSRPSLKPRLNVPMPPLLPSKISNSTQHPHALRTLEAGPEILSTDMLMLLGALPNLESLSISIPHDTPKHMILQRFPQTLNGFSALRHLGLYCYESHTTLLKLWNSLPFVQHLISVYVKVDSFLTAGDRVLRGILSSVCVRSPKLTDLRMSLTSEGACDCLDLFDRSVINSFGRLSLQRIRIVTPDSSLMLQPPDDFEEFALALSQVEYFELPNFILPFEGIMARAQYMPRLQFLGAELYYSCWPRKDDLPLTPPASESVLLIHSYLVYDYLHELDDRDNHAESLPIGLCRLWPNGVRCEFPELPERGEIPKLTQINQSIQELLYPREFTSPGKKVLVSRWEHSQHGFSRSPVYELD